MEIPTLKVSTCEREVAQFRSRVGRLDLLSTEQRATLLAEMRAFVESLIQYLGRAVALLV